MSNRIDERYPELREFTERLLLELRAAHQREERARRARSRATTDGDRRPLPERRRVRRRRVGLATAALAAGLAAALAAGVLPRRAGGPEAAKAAAFDRAASPARNGPYRPLRPGEYWYTRKRTVTYVEPAYKRYSVKLPLVREVWLGTDGTARIRVRSGRATMSAEARRAWIADGRPDLGLAFRTIDLSFHGVEVDRVGLGFAQDSRMDPRVTHLPYTQPMALAPLGEGRPRTYHQAVVSLPTDPAALVRKLQRQVALHERTPGERTPKPTALELRLSVYEAAATLLNDESPAPPALRRALLQVLRHLPGVQVAEGVRDDEGRSGVDIRFDPSAGVLNAPELIVDPATGLLLAERTTLATGKDFKGREVLPTVYLQYGVVPSIRATPAG